MKKPTKSAPKKPTRVLFRWGFIAACAVLLVALVGGWGFVQSRSTTEQQSPKVSDPSEGGKYLVIKEWGARFELPGEQRGDIYYKITYPEGGNVARVGFYSKKLDALKAACDSYEHIGTGVSLTRSPNADNPTFPFEQGRVYEDDVLVSGDFTTINEHNYSLGTRYAYPQDLCHKHTPGKSDPIWPEAKKIHDTVHKGVLTLEQMD